MKKIIHFFKKYSFSILFVCFLLVLSQFVLPALQQDYTRASIRAFKSEYGLPALLVVFIGNFLYQCVALWWRFRHNINIIRRRWVRIVLGGFLPKSITVTMLVFCIRDVFIAPVLFINGLYTHGASERTYVVHFLRDTTRAQSAIFLSDIASKEHTDEKVLQQYVYNTALKESDTVRIRYKTGLLGISLPDINHTKK
ncbi:hypothetical protein [Chitinophaga pinensis]|uniref:Uncharacterized protein n=1 Tax=Chitinophaga pinensis (strain ATCC 43595 / DSM 2588 / LMG 13176 / NBRC 15968 / NCIMB 11800 / UQM 2034) TaxID=485918 RepID=A0A979G785_CHIPD|nr:hypothetical protein [Chitinophaga pinensis]ACU62011.1 hypothetical protein Cpin_4569 [Chitinophaga pinensis DSM 2588]